MKRPQGRESCRFVNRTKHKIASICTAEDIAPKSTIGSENEAKVLIKIVHGNAVKSKLLLLCFLGLFLDLLYRHPPVECFAVFELPPPYAVILAEPPFHRLVNRTPRLLWSMH